MEDAKTLPPRGLGPSREDENLRKAKRGSIKYSRGRENHVSKGIQVEQRANPKTIQ